MPFQRERERQILKESGETVEYVYSDNLENYVMVPHSVIRRKCYPGYMGDRMHPVITLPYGQSPLCGSQSVISASPVSVNIPVLSQSIPVLPNSSPELVFILKRVPSNSEIVRYNTASPVEVVSDSSGCSLRVENKNSKHRIAHRCSDKEVSAPSSSAKQGVTVKTVNKSVKFRLKKV